jgi:hypothetical protein
MATGQGTQAHYLWSINYINIGIKQGGEAQ